MDRSERTPIIEPIMLILKKRTGIASIIAFIVMGFMIANGQSIESALAIVSPIFVYIGKQTIEDANESSRLSHDQVENIYSMVGSVKESLADGVQVEDLEEIQETLNTLFDTVEYLTNKFEEDES